MFTPGYSVTLDASYKAISASLPKIRRLTGKILCYIKTLLPENHENIGSF